MNKIGLHSTDTVHYSAFVCWAMWSAQVVHPRNYIKTGGKVARAEHYRRHHSSCHLSRELIHSQYSKSSLVLHHFVLPLLFVTHTAQVSSFPAAYLTFLPWPCLYHHIPSTASRRYLINIIMNTSARFSSSIQSLVINSCHSTRLIIVVRLFAWHFRVVGI